MPQINLLYPEIKKLDKSDTKPALARQQRAESTSARDFSVGNILPAVIFRSSIALVVCLAILAFFFFDATRKEEKLKKLKVETGSQAASPKDMEKLRAEKVVLEKKFKLIGELSVRKFLWSEKLKQIADLIPRGVWLTEVTSSLQRATQKDPEKTILVIRGVAVAYKIDDAISLIGVFYKNLQGSPDFSGDFSDIALNGIAKSSIGGLDVMQFDLRCSSK